jgi:hypothetical protein
MAQTLMASGVFRLKGRQLYGESISAGKLKNIQEITDRSGMTYPTAHRWVMNGADFKNLAGFLVDGLGLSPEEVSKMSFGDVFEFIPLADNIITSE